MMPDTARSHVQLAGEEAQRRSVGRASVAAADRERARTLLVAAQIDAGQGQQLMSDGRQNAVRLLGDDDTWRRVEAVAAALVAEGTLDGSRFRDLVAGT